MAPVSGSLVPELEAWIQSELPSVAPPPCEVLEELIKGPGAAELWAFLVQRVRAPARASFVRQALLVAGCGEEGSEREEDCVYEEELQELAGEAEALERDLAALRLDIPEDRCGVKEDEVRAVMMDAHEVVMGREVAGIEEVVRVLAGRTWAEAGDAEADGAADRLARCVERAVWAVCGAAREEVTHVCDTLEAARLEIAAVCETECLGDIAGALCRMVEHSSLMVAQSAEDFGEIVRGAAQAGPSLAVRSARDAQLDAFAASERVLSECQRAEKILEKELKAIFSSQDDAAGMHLKQRLLMARLEGERAALSYAERAMSTHTQGASDKGQRASLAAARRVTKRNERTLKQLDETLQQLLTRNRQLLQAITTTRAATAGFCKSGLKALQERTLIDLKTLQAAATATMHGLQDEAIPLPSRAPAASLLPATADALSTLSNLSTLAHARRQTAEQHAETQRGLRARACMSLDQLAEIRAHDSDKLLPRLKQLREAAAMCETREGVYALKEIRDWLDQPARQVAGWIEVDGTRLDEWLARA